MTIRRNIFLTARQKMNKFLKLVKHHVAARIKFVRSVISAYGWFKNTNMVKYRIRNKVDELMRIARKIASDHDKGNGYVEEKYFNMWRRYYAQGSKSRKMEKVVYKAKPNGVADVWLRNNQHEIVQETEDGPTGYEADEIFAG